MSPRRTFHSCGSSSSLVRRSHRPAGVTAEAAVSWLGASRVSAYMVRSL